MPRAFNHERAAQALTDAILMGDEAAAKKYEVSVRSIQEWRSRLHTDPVLVESFAKKKRLQDDAWADEIPAMLKAGIKYLKDAAQQCDPRDPDSVHAIAGAIKIVSEVEQVRKVIDARLANQD